MATTYTYPLTKEQSERVNAIHASDNAKINEELRSARSRCVEQCHSDTTKCLEHSKEVRRLWRIYYTNPSPGSWTSYRPVEYVTDMKKMFDSRVDIKRIHSRAANEKRMHYKDALCTIRFNDHPLVKEYKKEAAVMYDGNLPDDQILDFIKEKEAEVEAQRTPEDRACGAKLAACKTEDEKRLIYREHACYPKASDTPAMAKLRMKWDSLFAGNMPYVDICVIMNKDVDDHLELERALKEKLIELQRAKAAHDKRGVVKAEQKRAKDISARICMISKYTYSCTSSGCQNLAVPSSQEDGILECGICWKLVKDRVRKDRAYFCCGECMERSGLDHLLKEHNCAAAAACTTGVFKRSIHENYCGVCVDCWRYYQKESYFCTNECWQKNWRDHVLQTHTQLRAELTRKLVNDDEAFAEWKERVRLTEEEFTQAMANVSLSDK